MSTLIYHQNDGDLSLLRNNTIGIIGYGNQGRSQALNLRDSGLKVIVGNRDDSYKKRAQKDGFETYSISTVVKQVEFIFLLIPDELMKEIFKNHILPNLKDSDTIIFASGYTIAFNLINTPKNIDIILIAPRMIGVGVRERFLNKKGYYSFVGVHQNYTGNAKKNLLALSKGIGTLIKGAIETTFKQEAVLDLFNEQGFGPAFGQVLLKSIKNLIDAGYPPEAVLVEMFMSGEMGYTYQKMADVGLVKQTRFHSQTSQYGSMSRGIRFRRISKQIEATQKEILSEIESGEFAREWEGLFSKLKFKFIRFFATKIPFAKTEERVRKSLGMQEIDIFSEVPYPTQEDIETSKKIEKELEDFKEWYNEF